MVGSTDKFGVVAAYGTGEIKYDWTENFRSDGLRFDYEGLGSSRFVSAELIGYFAHSSPPDDEVSGKMGGGKHSSGSRPQCYDIGVDCRNGNSRYRTEDDHPNGYSDSVSGGKGLGLSSSFLGYKFIKWNKPNGVLLEFWQDQGSNNGATPANAWKKVSSWLCTDPKWFNPKSDHQETIRIDKVSTSSLKWKWLSLREIKTTDTNTGGGGSDGGSGGGGGTTPPPSGGGGGGGGTPIPPTGECTPVPSGTNQIGTSHITDPLTTVFVKFKDGTQMTVRKFNNLADSQRQGMNSNVKTIPYGTMFLADSSIEIRRDNSRPTPPSFPYTGVVADFVTYKNGLQTRLDVWNDQSDTTRTNKVNQIATIPYHHVIWEDGSIAPNRNAGTPTPPTGYTGKEAHYTTAINPSLNANSSNGDLTYWVELYGNYIITPNVQRLLDSANNRIVAHNILDDTDGFGENLVGKSVNILRVNMASYNSPTGTVYARHWNSSGHIKTTIGQIAASSIPDKASLTGNSGGWEDFEFINTNNRVLIANGDRIGIEYTAIGSGAVEVAATDQSIVDPTLRISILPFASEGGSWTNNTVQMLWGNIWTYITTDSRGNPT